LASSWGSQPGKVFGLSPKRGEVFVSGDYESATDNLPLSVAVAILEELKSLSVEVPESVWEIAFRSLRATVHYPEGEPLAQVRGQLMGNLLSFPLLCLQNYAAFRYLVPARLRVPVKINGDDIVFRTTREVYRKWADGVSRLGLVLSAGKTLVSSSVFSLNSAFFRAGDFGVSRIPVLRFTPLRDSVVSPHALSPGLASFRRGFRGAARVEAEVVYLRWRSKEFGALGRSVLRDLDLPVTRLALSRVGWLRREAFYLKCPPSSLPHSLQRSGVPELPSGWERVYVSSRREERRRQFQAQESFYSLLVSEAWKSPPVSSRKLLELDWRAAKTTGWFSGWQWWQSRSKGRSRQSPIFRSVSARMRPDWSAVSAFRRRRRVPRVWGGCGGSPGVGFLH
jgi:hypothetical protein